MARIIYVFVRPGQSFSTGSVLTTDADGRAIFEHVPAGTIFTFRAEADFRQQPCAAQVQVNDNMKVSLEVAARGAIPSETAPATLSGTVFLLGPQGRTPLASVLIAFRSASSSGNLVHGFTDAAGRYYFCRLPKGSGRFTVSVPTEDFDTVSRNVLVTISDDHALIDLEVQR
jgi:hypothetical protein